MFKGCKNPPEHFQSHRKTELMISWTCWCPSGRRALLGGVSGFSTALGDIQLNPSPFLGANTWIQHSTRCEGELRALHFMESKIASYKSVCSNPALGNNSLGSLEGFGGTGGL